MLSLEFARNLLENHNGKMVIIKATNDFPMDTEYWIQANYLYHKCPSFSLSVLYCGKVDNFTNNPNIHIFFQNKWFD